MLTEVIVNVIKWIMKNLSSIRLFCVAVTLLYSCASHTKIDPRPKDQQKFLSKLISLNSKITHSSNSIIKDELTDSALIATNTYITDTLHRDFTGWIAEVIDIENNPFGLNMVRIQLMLRYDYYADDEYPEYDSVIFTFTANKSDKTSLTMIKPLKNGDKVMIDGEFAYKNGRVEISDYGMGIGNESALSNPKISVLLRGINLRQPAKI